MSNLQTPTYIRVDRKYMSASAFSGENVQESGACPR